MARTQLLVPFMLMVRFPCRKTVCGNFIGFAVQGWVCAKQSIETEAKQVAVTARGQIRLASGGRRARPWSSRQLKNLIGMSLCRCQIQCFLIAFYNNAS
jgi:hypothetical protein